MSRAADSAGRGWLERAAFLLGRAVGGVTQLASIPLRSSSGAQRRSSQPTTLAHDRSPCVASAAGSHPAANRRCVVAPSPGDELERALGDPDPRRRRLALQTVAALEPERAARVLAGVLHDPDPSVRCAAIAAAMGTRTAALGFALILALDDPDAQVRATARAAVEALTRRTVDAAAMVDAASRRQLVDELKGWWKEQRLAELATESVP